MTKTAEQGPAPPNDRALAIAFHAAANAAGICDPKAPSPYCLRWPALEATGGSLLLVARDVLAPFVRRQPDAPPEALYRLAAAARVHAGGHDGWHSLPEHWQVAYSVFVTLLVRLDCAFAARAAEQARLEALTNPAPRPAIPREERALRRIDEDDDKLDLGRVGKITEARVARDEPAPPPRVHQRPDLARDAQEKSARKPHSRK